MPPNGYKHFWMQYVGVRYLNPMTGPFNLHFEAALRSMITSSTQ